MYNNKSRSSISSNNSSKFTKNSLAAISLTFLWLASFSLEFTTAALWSRITTTTQKKCSGSGDLKYLSGDALTDSTDCIGPNNLPYPSAQVARTFSNWNGGNSRQGRQSKLVDHTLEPSVTTSALLRAYDIANNNDFDNGFDAAATAANQRFGRSLKNSGKQQECRSSPQRLCRTRYNTTAPMYGVSLTSGQPVTIVQKFPDLLQQVVFEVCQSSECDVIHGECTQTYVPYLFLVIPLGPVTLTGQDYVLVESGCVCKPKYSMASAAAASGAQEPNSIP